MLIPEKTESFLHRFHNSLDTDESNFTLLAEEAKKFAGPDDGFEGASAWNILSVAKFLKESPHSIELLEKLLDEVEIFINRLHQAQFNAELAIDKMKAPSQQNAQDLEARSRFLRFSHDNVVRLKEFSAHHPLLKSPLDVLHEEIINSRHSRAPDLNNFIREAAISYRDSFSLFDQLKHSLDKMVQDTSSTH